MRWIGPNGIDITEDKSQRVHAESTGPHGHRLVVMNATSIADDGQYKCTLGSTGERNPQQHIEFDLKIYRTTSFRDTPRHLVLAAGQQGTLNCRVEFDPSVLSADRGFTVSWLRDHQPIDMLNDSSYSVIDYDPNKQLSQLIISPVRKQHDGIYTCRAIAITTQLSKISDHDIELETNYAPAFEKESQTVWVERSQSITNRHQQLQQQQQLQANVYSGNRHSQAHQNVRQRHNKHHPMNPTSNGNWQQSNNEENMATAGLESHALNATGGGGGGPQVLRVELRCTCQANPPASVIWSSHQLSNFALAKGNPAHILEQPSIKTEGHNTTSILVVGYSLDPDWPYKSNNYVCSASNKLGTSTMSFTIEQGDPPPAFKVAPQKQYNSQSSTFTFTLLGPNFDPDSPQQQQSINAVDGSKQPEIVPPVDSFRIRAENPISGGSSALGALSDTKPSYWSSSSNSNTRKFNNIDPNSVQWTLTPTQQQLDSSLTITQQPLNLPQNFTVNVGKLPSGNQKLYLEAHNAVGWSPNATYLGDYYIVSGALSLLILPLSSYLLMSTCLLLGIKLMLSSTVI